MKISEILYTVDRNLIQPDINKMIDKYHSRAKKRKSKMGYHSMLAYPFRVGEAWSKKIQKVYKLQQSKRVFTKSSLCW